MEFFILFFIVAWLWLFFDNKTNKTQLKQLRQRIIELTGRIATLEQSAEQTRYAELQEDKQPINKVSANKQTATTTSPPANNPTIIAPPAPKAPIAEPIDKSIDEPMVEQMIETLNPSVEHSSPHQTEKNPTQHTTISAENQDKETPAISAPKATPKPPAPSLWDKGIAYAKNWLTTGNIPVKIGMLVLIAAVIAFLRYATNQGWLRLPTEYKLLGVAAGAIGALVFAWLKRDSKRSFSLSVQGGSIGILLLVIFSAVKMYGLLSPNVGFVLSILAILLAAVLAVQQDAKILAIMAIFAGFLAPIWLSDGTGSHVVLFSYYAILNLGIFIIAWLKPWRELNLLGFVFTYVIGSTWGGLRYDEAHFATTEPFVILFFLFYLFIPLRYVHRQAQACENTWRYADRVDSALLFGTPLVTLGLQVGMLYNDSDKLALSCLAIGLVYAVLAWILRGKSAYATLQKAYTGLAAGFITLAVPIGLSAKATTTIFALEGAGALWLGTREKRPLTWLAGALLQVAAAIGFAVAYQQVSDFPQAIINDYYLNALLIAVAGWVATWICYRGALYYQTDDGDSSNQNIGINILGIRLFTVTHLLTAARVFFMWGMVWWLSAAVHEITHYAPNPRIIHDVFLLFTLTALALLFAYRYYRDELLVGTVSALIISGIGFAIIRLSVIALLQANNELPLLVEIFHPVSVYQLLTWGVYALVGLWAWRQLRDNKHSWIDFAVIIWVLALATTISTVIYQYLPATWRESGYYWWAITAVWLALLVVLRYVPRLATWVAQRPSESRWKQYLSIAVIAVLAVFFVRLLTLSGGDSTWWLPLLNSIELLQITIAGLLLSWITNNDKDKTENGNAGNTTQLLTYFAVVPLVMTITWRMIYHWIGSSYTEIRVNLDQFGDWYYLAIYGFWVVLALVIYFIVPKYLQRDKARWSVVSEATFNTIVVMLSLVWLYLLTFSGNAQPLSWIPVLNPLAVLQWSILGLAWLWMRQYPQWFTEARRSLIIPGLMLLLISVMTLRLVHHVADIDWGLSMFSTAITQMALTLIWSILGVVSWIVGSKRGSRPIWLLGAVLMSVVLLKLVLVDRGHLGNLYGILSFFAYGLLCVIVGYFAPVPPSAKHGESPSEDVGR